MRLDALFGLAALFLLGICLLFGYALSRTSNLWRIDVESAALRGGATALALVFTLSGRALPLFVIALGTLVLTARTRSLWKIAIAIFLAQLLSQASAELMKRAFVRARPDAWLVRQERGFSYPSGHSVTAVVFYGAWSLVIFFSALPAGVRYALGSALIVWAIGIMWSRIALGAHYPTDVIGGVLLGLFWCCLLCAFGVHLHALPSG